MDWARGSQSWGKINVILISVLCSTLLSKKRLIYAAYNHSYYTWQIQSHSNRWPMLGYTTETLWLEHVFLGFIFLFWISSFVRMKFLTKIEYCIKKKKIRIRIHGKKIFLMNSTDFFRNFHVFFETFANFNFNWVFHGNINKIANSADKVHRIR